VYTASEIVVDYTNTASAITAGKCEIQLNDGTNNIYNHGAICTISSLTVTITGLPEMI